MKMEMIKETKNVTITGGVQFTVRPGFVKIYGRHGYRFLTMMTEFGCRTYRGTKLGVVQEHWTIEEMSKKIGISVVELKALCDEMEGLQASWNAYINPSIDFEEFLDDVVRPYRSNDEYDDYDYEADGNEDEDNYDEDNYNESYQNAVEMAASYNSEDLYEDRIEITEVIPGERCNNGGEYGFYSEFYPTDVVGVFFWRRTTTSEWSCGTGPQGYVVLTKAAVAAMRAAEKDLRNAHEYYDGESIEETIYEIVSGIQ